MNSRKIRGFGPFAGIFAAVGLAAVAYVVPACVGDDPTSSTNDNDGGGSDATSDGSGGDSSNADSCASATTCGADTCVDLQSDSKHCGTCDKACKNSAGTSFACVKGTCGNKVVQLSAGRLASCVLLLDGSVWCWGQQAAGETGEVSALLTPVPQKVAGLSNIVALHSATSNSCAIDDNGDVWCWGDNGAGQLAQTIGTQPECGGNCNHTPQKVALPEKAAQITGSNETMCVRTVPGNVYCWGRNEGNILSLGVDVTQTHAAPLKITVFASDVTDLDLTYANNGNPGIHAVACAVRADKTVWCWGSNIHGELGHTPATGSDANNCYDQGANGASSAPYACNPSPQQIPGASGNFGNAVKVKTRNAGACALRTDNTVWCWGNNGEGELGMGAGTAEPGVHTTPVQIGSLSARLLTSSDVTNFSIAADGGVYGWGLNNNGVLGDGDYVDGNGAVLRLSLLDGIADLSTYADHGLALKADGTMLAWGNNTNATLGHAPHTGTDVGCPPADAGACNATPTAFGTVPWQ